MQDSKVRKIQKRKQITCNKHLAKLRIQVGEMDYAAQKTVLELKYDIVKKSDAGKKGFKDRMEMQILDYVPH